MSVHGLISRELLVSLNALHKHAYIQLNCYIVQFCQACCPSHVFVLYPIIVIFVFVWRMLSLCDVFCFLFLVVDIKKFRELEFCCVFVGNVFFDVFCFASFPSDPSVSNRFSIRLANCFGCACEGEKESPVFG